MNLPIALILPYPPSDNERYVYYGKVPKLSEKVKRYREEQCYGLYSLWVQGLKTITEPVQAVVYPYPPPKSTRDLTNCLKELWDSLQAAKILKNDNLVVGLRMGKRKFHVSDAVFVEFWPEDATPPIIEGKTLERRINDAKMHEDFTGKVFATDDTWKKIAALKPILDWRELLKESGKKKKRF